MKIWQILSVGISLSACSLASVNNGLSTTGEPGISMGDSYEKVVDQLSKRNTIIKNIEDNGDRGIVAVGYSDVTHDCRKKLFIFLGNNGLQHVQIKPAPGLSVSTDCRPTSMEISSEQ